MPKTSQRINSRLVGGAAAMVILGSGIWITSLLRRQANAAPVQSNALQFDQSAEANEARINKTRQLRGAWHKWAKQHKYTLHNMLHPQPGHESEALHNAYEALPSYLTDDGRTGITYRELNAGGIQNTWNPIVKLHGTASSNSPTRQQQVKKEHDFAANRLQTQYDKIHDIEISQSLNPGPTNVTLWASGRITTSTMQFLHDPTGTTMKEGEPKEIEPPFDDVDN